MTMRIIQLFLMLPFLLTSVSKAIANDNEYNKKSMYTESYIASLIMAEQKQDDKEAILSRLIQSTQNTNALANLYCRRAKIRITHTHLPNGIEDLKSCINTLSAMPNNDEQKIEKIKQSLEYAIKKYEFTKSLAHNKENSIFSRFTALWKLGEREQAVKSVKEEATPEKFSSMSTTRLVKAGYLCKGAGPNGAEKSYRTKKGGPFWWCDELE